MSLVFGENRHRPSSNKDAKQKTCRIMQAAFKTRIQRFPSQTTLQVAAHAKDAT
jgi:hypothetical protein